MSRKLDNDGAILTTTSGEGVVKQSKYNIFRDNTHLINGHGSVATMRYDANRNMIGEKDENGWTNDYEYNENKCRTKSTDGNVELFGYMQPFPLVTIDQKKSEGQILTSTNIYDQHRNLTVAVIPDGRANIWWHDYLNTLWCHEDLNRTRYSCYNHPLVPEVSLYASSGNPHMQQTNDGSQIPIPHILTYYDYDEASQQVGVADCREGGSVVTTVKRFDPLGREARHTFYDGNGMIRQATWPSWNACNYLTMVQDTRMQANYAVDVIGSRRRTRGTIFWNDTWLPAYQDLWFTYNRDNAGVIVEGVMRDGVIDIAPGQGTRLLYDVAGWRESQITQATDGATINQTLSYLNNGLLSGITSYRNGTITHRTGYGYDNGERRTIIDQFDYSPHQKQSSHQTNTYTEANYLKRTHTHDFNAKQISDTTYTLNPQGLPTYQETKVTLDAQPKPPSSLLSCGFNNPDAMPLDLPKQEGMVLELWHRHTPYDSDQLQMVHGKEERLHGGTNKGYVTLCLDGIGTVLVKEGEVEGRYISYLTNTENRIICKQAPLGNTEYYFYVTTKDGSYPVASFGNVPIDDPTFMSRCTLNPTPSTTTGMPNNCNFDLNYSPVSENFPPASAPTDTVQEGDTFESISRRNEGGDPSYAAIIAFENGYTQGQLPEANTTIRLPNTAELTAFHNRADEFAEYDRAKIIGATSPNIPTPARKKKHEPMWHEALEIGVGVAILCLAPEFVALLSALGLTLSTLLGYGLAGIASSVDTQETAIALGDQGHIAWNEAAKAGVMAAATAGFAQKLGLTVTGLDTATYVLRSTELAAIMQGMSFAMGAQTHFNWEVFATAVINGTINGALNKAPLPGSTMMQGTESTILNTVIDTGIQAGLGHTRLDAANILGTFIGNWAGNQLAQCINTTPADTIARNAATPPSAEVCDDPLIDDPIICDNLSLSTPSLDYQSYRKNNLYGVNPTFGNRTNTTKLQRQSTLQKKGGGGVVINDRTYTSDPQHVNSHLNQTNAEKASYLDKMCRISQTQSAKKDWGAVVASANPTRASSTAGILGKLGSAIQAGSKLAEQAVANVANSVVQDTTKLIYGDTSQRLDAVVDITHEAALTTLMIAGGDVGVVAAEALAPAVARLGLFADGGVAAGAESLATRQRVLGNIAESWAARNASYFKIHTHVEEALRLDVSSETDSATFWSGSCLLMVGWLGERVQKKS